MTTSDNGPTPFITIWAENGQKFKFIPELAKDKETTKDENGKPFHPARATMEEGFPEVTMKSAMRGGVPPWGQDHNKILSKITDAIQWMQAGGCAFFNKALCDKIKGYPKGAMLQGKKIEKNEKNETIEVPLLWFSTINSNLNDPNTTTSPDNGWVKLDFADLEKRLKAAENHIVMINSDEYNDEKNIKTFGDVYYKLGTKAAKEGSCDTPFHAKTMKAGEYRFCNSPDEGDGYITQKEKSIDFFCDNRMNFNLKDNPLNPVISILGGWGFDENDKPLYKSFCQFNASSITASGGWFSTDIPSSVDGVPFMFRTKDQKIAWSTVVDKSSKNLIMSFFNQGYIEDSPSFEVFEISSENGDIKAIRGSFLNVEKGDLAEYYQSDRQDYEPGTLMCHGVNSEVTLCKNSDQLDNFFGVISTCPAYIMNGKAEKDPNAVLIALNGKVPVKVKGVVTCGDKITVGQDGYGIVSKDKNDVIIGRAKENKITEEVGLVSCYVQAHI
ncbi:hypothetical protein [Commensalibacter papalotli (ex Botero et al. 2024)]|uniref:Tail fiber protein n=1 Tax=Commensalibacter papalotli (ex Botero et al. 2024) TaxID=2972766 RepID=A0ABN8W436_9PROT|nr:hypothetical protein [Commensalibacter papalotli (ex Botero et al. 2024)]CAI3931801.1 unnamed protein product [Commensalibacter papalotli (ex Botero et al. 2024)]CAI3946906.1 unnamed protein product [Commensalibacter papalotli (ex Botero et al. 2024)]